MELFPLTRELIDIESITPNEGRIGEFLFRLLSELAARFDGVVEKLEVEPDRCNVFCRFGAPVVVL